MILKLLHKIESIEEYVLNSLYKPNKDDNNNKNIISLINRASNIINKILAN